MKTDKHYLCFNKLILFFFIQIHLEEDPSLYEADENTHAVLKQNDKFRLEILSDILNTHLGLTLKQFVTNTPKKNYKCGYFLGRHEHKLQLLDKLKLDLVKSTCIDTGDIVIKFYGKNEKIDNANEKLLPVYVHSCPEDFSTILYFDVSQLLSIIVFRRFKYFVFIFLTK